MSHPPAETSCKNCSHSYTARDDVTYPPFPEHLLTANIPPSEQELLDFKDALSTVDLANELATIDKEISSLNRALDALHTRRTRVEFRLNECKSISSPIRRLPSEIILEIMTWATSHAVAPGELELEPVTFNTRRGIWVYSQVCRRWRANALSTPSFWSTISIDANIARRGRSYLELLPTVLSHSGNYPLSFEFVSKPQVDWRVTERLLTFLTERTTQWRKASFKFSPTFLVKLAPMKKHIPNLESFSLDVENAGYVMSPPVDYLQDAPALRKVTFSSRLIMPKRFQLPWSQITHYKAVFARVNILGDPLSQMPNLLHLDLAYQDQDQDQDYDRQLELESLQTLRVVQSRHTVSALTLPALRELDVSILELEPIIDLVKRSGCRITTLTLHPSFCSDSTILLRFLGVIPSLSVLDLSSEDVGNFGAGSFGAVFKALIGYTEEYGHCLPVLTELILPSIHLSSDVMNTVLIDFLQQRRHPDFISPTTRAIESVVFVGDPEPLSTEIQTLQRGGLCVSFMQCESRK